MNDFIKSLWQVSQTANSKRTLGVLALLIVVAAVPLTVMVSQQQQEIRQRAAEVTTTGAVPLSILPTNLNSPINTSKYVTTTFQRGPSDIRNAMFLVSVDGGGINNFYAYYDNINNKLFLRNADNTAWLGGQIPTSAGSIDNGYFRLRYNNTNTVNSNTTNLVINWYIEPLTPTDGKTYRVFIRAQDKADIDSGWSEKGTWTIGTGSVTTPSPTTPVSTTLTPTPTTTLTPTLIPILTSTPTSTPRPTPTLNPRAPTPVSVVPNSGSKPANQPTYFTTKFSDTAGFANIEKALFLISVDGSGKNDFYGYYNHSSNKVYLRSKDNTSWLGGYALTTANSISNDYFKLHVNNTNTTNSNGNDLVVNWYIEPLSLANNKTYKLFIRGFNKNNDDSGWIQKGTWTVGAAPTLPPSGQLKLSLSLKLQGIGDDIQIVDGDGRPFTLPSNKTPLHTTRQTKVELYNLSDQKVGEATGELTYNSTEKTFKGDVLIANPNSPQVYAKVKIDKYLRKRIPGIIDANASVGSNGINLPSVTLIVADINNDNKIDALDYNAYTSCFGDKANDPSSCRDKTAVDLYDNGRIDGREYQMNYLLLLNSFSVREGD